MQFGGQFERRKPAPAQLSLWQASFFFSSLLAWLSTSMQSLKHSIEGSKKLGQVKTGQSYYLECSTPDSLGHPVRDASGPGPDAWPHESPLQRFSDSEPVGTMRFEN